MKPSDSNDYRPDIDGLRALAVTLVVLFHTDLAFPGGYIGVDVFFVISGYLITRLILSDISQGQFSFSGFWIKRIRRIAPVLLVVVLTVLIFGLAHLWPDDLVVLSRSALSVLSIASNWYFWSDLGYFGGRADTQPLLHTWSLAVEEQFYLVYPFMLVLISKHGFCRKFLPLLLFLTASSFVLSLLVWYRSPSAAFYFLPPRSWELLVGALLAFNLRLPGLNLLARNVVALAGLLAICGCAILFTKSTPFPGVAALVPVIGTAAIVYTGKAGGSFVTSVLSLKPIVFFGLISYSLYLWHWPLLLFARIRYPYAEHLEWAVIAASIVLSVVTWKLIEQPFRRSSMPLKKLLAFMVVFVMAILGISLASHATNGFPSRHTAFDTLERNSKFEVSDAKLFSLSGVSLGHKGKLVQSSDVDFFVVGDSHAAMMLPMFDKVATETGLAGLSLARAARKPFGDNAQFKPITQAIIQMIELHKPTTVFLVARWAALFGEAVSATDYAENLLLLRKVIESGTRYDVDMLLVSQVPDYQLPRAVLRYQIVSGKDSSNYPDIDQQDLQARTKSISTAFEQLITEGAQLIDLSQAFYDSNGEFNVGSSPTILYWDTNHLTQMGAIELLSEVFRPVMQNISTDY